MSKRVDTAYNKLNKLQKDDEYDCVNNLGNAFNCGVKLAINKANNDVDILTTEMLDKDIKCLSDTDEIVREEITFRTDRMKTIVI